MEMNIQWGSLAVACLLVVAAGCSANVSNEESEATAEEIRGRGRCDLEQAAGAWRRLTTDTTGRVLATAYREHAPTRPERRLSAVFWLLLVHAERTGELHPVLLNPALRRGLTELRSTWSLTHARGRCADTRHRGRHDAPVPPSCSDDCRRAVRGILPAIANIEGTLAPTLPSLEGMASHMISTLASLDDAEIGSWTVERISSLLSNGEARRVLETVGAAVAPTAAIRQATVDLRPEGSGRREVAVLAGTLGVLVTGSALESTLEHLGRAVGECRQWQIDHCTTDSGVDVPCDDAGDGGTADLGDVEDATDATDGGEVTPSGAVVRVVYIVPTDKAPNPLYVERLTRSIEHVQRFYHSELATGQTFSLSDPIVELRQSSHPSSYYATSPAGGEPAFSFWYNVVGDGFALTGGAFDDPNSVWLFYVDADNMCGQLGGAGTSGVAAFPANDLRGFAGEALVPACEGDLPDGYAPPLCRWVGGMAHELGHAFGLPHPPGCDEGAAACGSLQYSSLMWIGYSTYPATYLLPDDTATLRMSRFLVPAEPRAAPFDCNEL